MGNGKTMSTDAVMKPSEVAARLLAENKYREAAQVLSEAIAEGESSELWNDWAVVQYAMNELADAERALRRALALEAGNDQAAENLGALLFSQRRLTEARPWLTQALRGATGEKHEVLERLIGQCGENAAAELGGGTASAKEAGA